ncbi:N-acetylglucosamine kinase [Ekhidna sp.]
MPNSSFIIGDAGGTGTQWRLVSNGVIDQFTTVGFNAYTHSLNELKEDIGRVFGNKIEKNIPVFFYAAGVDTPQQQKEVKSSLIEIFGDDLYVENDLVGVARSLCGKKEGNVCILGTGANACYYDGKSVNKVGASLGFILGDEGSGAYLGKKLLTQLFRDQLSSDIIDIFQKEFDLTSHEVIQRIYDKPLPNQYLASFAPFIYNHRNHPDVYKLIYKSFEDFFAAFFHRSDYSSKAYHFSGSIAYYFSDTLRQLGNDKGILISNIIESPIARLVLYHQEND